jgi:hypothetical protein
VPPGTHNHIKPLKVRGKGGGERGEKKRVGEKEPGLRAQGIRKVKLGGTKVV